MVGPILEPNYHASQPNISQSNLPQIPFNVQDQISCAAETFRKWASPRLSISSNNFLWEAMLCYKNNIANYFSLQRTSNYVQGLHNLIVGRHFPGVIPAFPCNPATNHGVSRETHLTFVPAKLPKLKAILEHSLTGAVLLFDTQIPHEDTTKIARYHLLTSDKHVVIIQPPDYIKHWRSVDVITAAPLPIAVDLTSYVKSSETCYFSVMPVDIFGNKGELSFPCVVQKE